ncbi:MAG TPA: dTMP kinase [Verrucomicrobiae bacterium]|nr:dTMP kinase [Verrucomicrobiae bacterium]
MHWELGVGCSMLDVFYYSMRGLFITFEGNEGSGKTTQILFLAERLRELGHKVRTIREPGGTPIGEEVRHTLKHSKQNAAMTAEAELLLMNASRAQLVREVISPALAAGEIVISDRFYDSTTAYQGYGRQLDLKMVKAVIDIAVGKTRPDVTLLFNVPPETSEARLRSRQSTLPFVRDRIEEADKAFFERVTKGYEAIAAEEPERVKIINAARSVEAVRTDVWQTIQPALIRAQNPKK